MDKEYLKLLFDKYSRDECSDEEVKLLDGYLDSFRDKEILWSELDYDYDVKEKLWVRIKSGIKVKDKPVKKLFHSYIKYAAIFIGFIAVAGLFYQMTKEPLIIKDTQVLVTNDSPIILKMSNNVITEMNTNEGQVLIDKTGERVAEQKGDLIRYVDDGQNKDLVYNEIIVPDGKKFRIMLSDGTLVHINSRSSLRYPTNFVSGNERKVFLEGEAYFEVAKDAKHPFLVATPEIGVKVLGTHFVVSSYKEGADFAVLAEGSVAVYKGLDWKTPIVIEPKEKATIEANGVTVKTVELSDYLGWMDGTLTFNDEIFEVIVHKIERHYGVEIYNEYEDIDFVKFRGTFNDETITDVLDTFKESAGFEYKIQDNKILISKSN